MRILIVSMPSSAASLIAFFLAQKAGCLAAVDLGMGVPAPYFWQMPFKKDVIIKTTINTKTTLSEQAGRFRPHRTILALRNPYDNYASLKNKPYADLYGTIEEKYAILENHFLDKNKYNLILLYEDYILNRDRFLAEASKLNFGITSEFFKLTRTAREILNFNMDNCRWFAKTGRWGFGNIHFDTGQKGVNLSSKIPEKVIKGNHLIKKPISVEEKTKVKELCPNVCKYYEELFPQYC